MFKIGMALTFAVIGAMIVLLAGIFGGARISTAFLRMFCALLVTCAGVWIFLFILEARGVVDIDKKLRIIQDEEEAEVAEEAELTDEEFAVMAAEAEAEIQAEETAAAAEEARAGSEAEADDAEAGEAAEGDESEAQEPADEENGGFEPLAADDLQHMDTAEEEETRAS